MFQIGLKLWSTNENYISEAIRLYDKKIYQYIELYSVPDSFQNFSNLWKKLNIPFIIHAAHYGAGMNLANKESLHKNLRLANEAKKFADALKADKIIFHPGVEGKIEETLHQLIKIKDLRIVIENKPYFSFQNTQVCVGHSPEEIKILLEELKIGFCLDFGHAICAANAKKVEPLTFIDKMLELKPVMYHLTDGDYSSNDDWHYHYKQGSFPLKEIIKKIPLNSLVTNESEKKSQENLHDFEEDILILKKIADD